MQSSDLTFEDRIAKACLDTYKSLGPKGKPRLRKDGVREWSVLAGFVLHDTEADHLEVVSLGTGLKCLPADKLPLYGDVLHDSHAEIIARRGLRLWLYGQLDLYYSKEESNAPDLLEPSVDYGPFLRIKPKYKLAMYISTLPCGDASMKLLAKLQDPDVAAAFVEDQPLVSTGLARGRQGFNTSSALRTKPARADAISTTSLSCSDKLASYTVLGIPGALLSYFLEPIYIDTYVFGGVPAQFRAEIAAECQRALLDRLGEIQDLQLPYHVHQPTVRFTDLDYPHAKLVSNDIATLQTGCHESLSWIRDLGTEVISQGVKQGAPVKHGVPQKSKAISRICRVKLFEAWHNLRAILPIDARLPMPAVDSYFKAKQGSTAYQSAKVALRDLDGAPFSRWLRNDDKYQNFHLEST